MLCVEEEPQQFQSSSSTSLNPSFLHTFIRERLFSLAEVASEHPGK
jgi:hypothetical protein